MTWFIFVMIVLIAFGAFGIYVAIKTERTFKAREKGNE